MPRAAATAPSTRVNVDDDKKDDDDDVDEEGFAVRDFLRKGLL